MVIRNWKTRTSPIVYRRFQPGESLIEVLESLARSEGIREATITSCIGSLRWTPKTGQVVKLQSGS